jgi:IrrE N-terminal-like domain
MAADQPQDPAPSMAAGRGNRSGRAPRTRPAFDKHGCRTWRAEVEDEAEWLAGVLLITEEAAVAVARRNIPSAVAAGRYGVSEQMMRYRLNLPGAYRRVPGG